MNKLIASFILFVFLYLYIRWGIHLQIATNNNNSDFGDVLLFGILYVAPFIALVLFVIVRLIVWSFEVLFEDKK